MGAKPTPLIRPPQDGTHTSASPPQSAQPTPTEPPSPFLVAQRHQAERRRRALTRVDHDAGLSARAVGLDDDDVRRRLEKRQSVVTVTSNQVATSTSTASKATKIPIAPIVGGIIAGVVVVLLAGGIWYWCHMKGVKEAEERRQRKEARAARAAAIAAGKPMGLTTRVKSEQSVTSLTSLNKGGVGAEKMIPLGGVGGHSRGGSAVSAQSAHTVPYGNGPQQGPYGQSPYDQQHGRQINNGGYADPTSPSAASSSGSSSKSERSKRPRHQTSTSNASSVSDPPNSADPLRKYQPVKPSPLAAGAVRAAPKADDGPKWGQGPFRSKSEDDHDGARQGQQQLAYPQNQGSEMDREDHRKTMMSDASDYGGASSAFDGGHPSGGAYSGNVGLAPPIEEEVLASDGSRGRSGEWGVAYSGGGHQQQHDPYAAGADYGHPNRYIAEPTTTQPQRSNYNYATSSPPRARGDQDDQYAYHQYQQDMPPSSVSDPYAGGYATGGAAGGRQAMDPYAYAGGGGQAGNGSGGYGNRI